MRSTTSIPGTVQYVCTVRIRARARLDDEKQKPNPKRTTPPLSRARSISAMISALRRTACCCRTTTTDCLGEFYCEYTPRLNSTGTRSSNTHTRSVLLDPPQFILLERHLRGLHLALTALIIIIHTQNILCPINRATSHRRLLFRTVAVAV